VGKTLQAESFNYRILGFDARLFFQRKISISQKKKKNTQEKEKEENSWAYRNSQYKINTPIRAFMANISNGSSQTDTDNSV